MSSVEENQKRNVHTDIFGETPDNELTISPRWMVLEPTGNYANPIRCVMTIENVDEYPVAFCVRTKERHMPRFNFGYGILKEKETISIDVIIPPACDWIKSEEDVIAKHHKIVFENLRLPSDTPIPKDVAEKANMGRQIFRTTQNYCPFIRLYTKTHLILLPKNPKK